MPILSYIITVMLKYTKFDSVQMKVSPLQCPPPNEWFDDVMLKSSWLCLFCGHIVCTLYVAYVWKYDLYTKSNDKVRLQELDWE